MLFADFTSIVFNLLTFTALASLLSLLLLRLGTSMSRKALYNTFLLLGGFALLTQLSYVYAPKRIFSNASHHMIEQIGFSFNKSIVLADDQKPEEALWDSRQGKLVLSREQGDRFLLRGTNFFEPVFVSRPQGYYELVNPVSSDSLTEVVSVHLDDSLSIDFLIHHNESETYTFVPKYLGRAQDTIHIQQKNLKNGYSLSGMLAESRADFPMLGRYADLLENSWVLRKRFNPDKSLDLSETPLVFFPSKMLLDSAHRILVDGRLLAASGELTFDLPLSGKLGEKDRFYTGLWSTRNKIYTVEATGQENGTCILSPSFSDKKPLKKLEREQESLFITSSSDEVADNELLAGFYYPYFAKDNNLNHFAATIAYNEGNTREQMKFRMSTTDKNDLLQADQRLFNAGDTIRIETMGATQGKLSQSALFKITDLKATNPLQWWHMAAFTALLVICIFISIFLTPEESLTKTEVITYLLVLVLMTIRSILLWRVSTFPPTEDISPKVYQELVAVGGTHFFIGAFVTFVFFAAIWSWKIWGAKWIAKRNFSGEVFTRRALPLLLIGGFYLFAATWKFIPFADRFSAVFAPLLAFFSIEFLLLLYARYHQRSTVYFSNYKTLSFVNWLACFAYLALSDAGFSIVFTMSSLLYWLLRLLVFPDQQIAREGGSRFAHWRFVIPFFLLLTILFASPWLLSVLFQNAKTAIAMAAGVLVVLAAVIQYKKVTIWEGNRRINRIVGGAMLGAAVLMLAFSGVAEKKISDKAYIRYRAEVLFKTPDEIIRNEKFLFNLGNDSKLLRAAQNQWIINHYYSKDHLGLLDYFRLLPSFQKGSPYMTQISDLVTVRYLIGEHSQFIVFQLLFMMIVLVISSVTRDTRFNLFSKMRVQLLCIFFMVGFFIWMAATNRMVFLGQDFPLLSLNSKLTLAFSFSILLTSIILGHLANADKGRTIHFNDSGRKVGYFLVRTLLMTGTLLILMRQTGFDNRKFDLDETASQLQSAFDPINDLFAEYQSRQVDSLRRRPPLDQLIKGFDESIRHEKDSLFKSDFALSAYDAYRTQLSRQNSSENLIHLRRGADSVYSFAVNKLYYNVYSPDIYEHAWKGNVLAADNSSSFSFLDRATRTSHILDVNRFDSQFAKTIQNAKLANMNENQNLRLSVVPAGWLPDSTPAVIVSRTQGTQLENRSDFVVKNGTDVMRSATIEKAMVLQPGDIVQFIPSGQTKPVNLQYKHKGQAYLAKNVWLNGRQQFFYPLREKFLWSFYFTNLVKSKFDSDGGENAGNVQSTIDEEITSGVRDLAAGYFEKENARLQKSRLKGRDREREISTSNARAFNLVVLDDQGKVRALCDYKNGDKVKLNPNRMTEFIAEQETSSLQTDVDKDRLIFGNRCLMRMDNGPASTFKPILYSAVTSQYNFGWPQLEIGQTVGALKDPRSEDDFIIKNFGGKNITFHVPENNLRPHDMQTYISKSTNSYNSMIVFLGSLSKPEIGSVHAYVNRTAADMTFLARGGTSDSGNNFPVFMYKNERYLINKFPEWKDERSLMATGLWENFDMPTRNEHLRGTAGKHIQNIAWSLKDRDFDSFNSTYKLWSFPEPSHVYAVDRINLHAAIVQLAAGADPIYATPLKMAEMAGKLYSFNKGYKATVVDGPTQPFEPLTADASWQGQDQLAGFYSRNLFSAMHKTITGGTAENMMKDYLKQFKGYHFYAKTGTISGNRYGGKRDKHLMLIISKNPVHDRDLTPEDLKDNKFYVLYFSMYKQASSANWGTDAMTLLQESVKTVIGSAGFKSHMQ